MKRNGGIRFRCRIGPAKNALTIVGTILVLVAITGCMGGFPGINIIVVPPVEPPAPPVVPAVPDLIIDSVTHSPTSPAIGDSVAFTVKVKNQGRSDAAGFHVQLARTGYAAQWFVTSLAAGATMTLQTTIPTSTSPETFTATADNLGEVPESNETNNSAQDVVTAAMALPDLVVDSLTYSPANPHVGDPVAFSVTVKNQGAWNAGGFHVQLAGAAASIGGTVASLAAGASTTLTLSLNLSTSPETLTATADNLNEVAESDEANNTAPDTVTADSVVNFPDPNLESAIRTAIGKPTGDIYESDLAGLTQLVASMLGISELTGIEHCTHLRTVYMPFNQISDLAPLSGLTSLTYIELRQNQISDLSPLSALTALEVLYMQLNRISDLTPLSGLAALSTLDMSFNQISDLTPLSGLTALESLGMDYNQINDLTPLSGLTALAVLTLGANPISNVEPLAGLTALVHLNLYDTSVGDLSPLAGLTALGQLYLFGNQITDLGPLVLNGGIDTGDTVDVSSNYLCIGPGGDDLADISALLARGVHLTYNPQMGCR